MNLLFATSELFPFIKTGGLADVVPALAQALTQLKHHVSVVLPAYDQVLEKIPKPTLANSYVHPVTLEKVEILISQALAPVKFILVKNPLFERKTNPYVDEHGKDWDNNFDTFSLFSWAAAEVVFDKKVTGGAVDVAISNDWQTGLLSSYICHANERNKARVKTAHIIHNIAFPGIFPYHCYSQLGLPNRCFHVDGMEYHGQISFQKSALYFSNKIFTVSPTYAEELKSSRHFGMGFEGILAHRSHDLVGIMNGVDEHIWSPLNDTHLAKNYGLSTLADKHENKMDLFKSLKAKGDKELPLVGMVTRLSEQKGIDVLVEFFKTNDTHTKFQWVIVGAGDPAYVEALMAIEQQHKHVHFVHAYDEVLAHKVIAGADIFFMPSRFEPCGLTQQYAMNYGTLPLVHPVGGLKDSVIHFDGENKTKANGFYLGEMSVRGFEESLLRVWEVYSKKTLWNALKKNAMRADVSWKKAAKLYEAELVNLCSSSKTS